jgi:hypothetical protein
MAESSSMVNVHQGFSLARSKSCFGLSHIGSGAWGLRGFPGEVSRLFLSVFFYRKTTAGVLLDSIGLCGPGVLDTLPVCSL